LQKKHWGKNWKKCQKKKRRQNGRRVSAEPPEELEPSLGRKALMKEVKPGKGFRKFQEEENLKPRRNKNHSPTGPFRTGPGLKKKA